MTAALVPEAAGLAESAAARSAAAGGAASAAKKTKTGSKSVRHAKKTVSGQTRETATSRSRESDSGSHVSEQVRTHKRGRSAGTRRSSPGASGAKRFSAGTLIAEWVLGLILIVVTVPMEKSENGYATTISTMMLRLSGLTGIFFALALLSESEHARKFAVWFGFLIDLGIIYHATTSGSTKKLAGVFSGKSGGSGGVVLASDFTDKGGAPQPTPFGDATTHVFGSGGGAPAPSSPAPSGGGNGAYINPNYPGGSQTIPNPPVGGSA